MKKTVQYNVSDAKARFSSLVREALAGSEVIIAKDNKPLVRVVPFSARGQRAPGSAKGQVGMEPDFDTPLDDFREYR
jgi:prevent-host-death family protein